MQQTPSFNLPANPVNYTTVLASAPNEVYLSTTQSPDCLSNLIKNNTIIELSITPKAEGSTVDEKDISATILR